MKFSIEDIGRVNDAKMKYDLATAAYAEAIAKIEPLKQQVDEAAQILAEFGFRVGAVKTRKAGTGTRGARSFSAVAMTMATRNLRSDHKAGKKKIASLNAAMEHIGVLAETRGVELTEEIRNQIAARADELWGVAKK